MKAGDRLGRYVLHRILGEGGMGVVWAATHQGPAGFEKPVALKVLREGGEGLVHEARLGGLLRHPNLVEVYTLEEIDGTWVCAMERIDGGSYHGRVLAPSELIDVGLQVAAGLSHAHESVGLVHLDLKPANLLRHHGLVKVADLGISRARGFRGDGRVRGTPAYMAPEYAAGHSVDARADIFSFGVVLIELATGTPSRDPADVPWLADVLARCLAPDPNERFRTMREVSDALGALAERTPATTRSMDTSDTPATSTATASDTWTLDPSSFAPTNLEPARDPFVGRVDDRRHVTALLDPTGALVTLKGTGGLGKTRLARETGLAWHRDRAAEVRFCDLSEATDRMGLLQAVATGLGVPLTGGDAEALATRLGWAMAGRGPDLLVVLDNYEQLMDCADLVDTWRALAPETRFLVTSREPLRRPGEQVVALGPLEPRDALTLLHTRTAARGLDLGADPDLAELARELDHLPLALELVAGRLGTISPRQALDRLGQRLKLLRTRDRSVTARQASLAGALEWSWSLMDEVERSALAQCSLFAGGFTLEAAEAVLVLPDDAWVLDAIEDLVDRSMLTMRPDNRVGLLRSVHAFASARLAEWPAEEVATAVARHARHFAALGSVEAIEGYKTHGGSGRLQALVPELDNLVLAARRAAAPADAAACCRAANQVYGLRGPFQVGAALALEMAERADLDPMDRAYVLASAAESSRRSGQLERARELQEQVLTIDRAQGDRRLEGRTLGALAGIASDQGRSDDALTLFEQALALQRANGDRPAEAFSMTNLGILHQSRGHLDQALECLERGLALHREFGNRQNEGQALNSLAALHHRRGDLEAAERIYREALAVHQEVGNRMYVGIVLANLGTLHRDRGQHDEARALWAQALEVHREVGNRRSEAYVLGNLGSLEGELGQLEEANAHLRTATEQLTRLGDTRATGILLTALARVFAAQERPEACRRALADGRTALTEAGAELSLIQHLAATAELEAQLGDLGAARAALAEAEARLDGKTLGESSDVAQALARARAACT